MSEDGSESTDRSRRTRDDRGRFTSTADCEYVLDAMEPHEPYSATELAERVGIPNRTALKYLNELAESERVRKKCHSKRHVTWIRATDD